MESIGLFEAKTHFSELVARAEQGEELIITRHNKPVAKLVPIGAVSSELDSRRLKAVRAMQAIGDEVAARSEPISKKEILAWIREGRR